MWKVFSFVCIIALFWSDIAFAYIGPGAGAGAIAVVIGIIASIGLAIVALFWYPIKRMMKSKKKEGSHVEADAEKEIK